MGRNDVRVLGQVLAVLELFLEASPRGPGFADGLDRYLVPRGLVLCDPRGTVGPFAGLLDEREAIIKAGLIRAVVLCGHHLCKSQTLRSKETADLLCLTRCAT